MLGRTNWRHLLLLATPVGVLAVLMGGCPAATEDNLSGAPQDDAAGAEAELGIDLAREIEEADIVKDVDGILFVANPYRGLRIIDARNMAAPVLTGGLQVTGRTVELFVRDSRAYLFTAADFFNCAGTPLPFYKNSVGALLDPDYDGSRLWIIDVSDINNPTEVKHIDFDGFVDAVRRVGDVIYAVGKNYDVRYAYDSYYYGYGADVPVGAPRDPNEPNAADPNASPTYVEPGVFVTSINITDPANADLVETETIPVIGSSLYSYGYYYGYSEAVLDIQVGDSAIYVLDPELGQNTTVISYVDISDSTGNATLRNQFRVVGTVKSRFFVDESDGFLRLVTSGYDAEIGATATRLFVYDVRNPDSIGLVGNLPIVRDMSAQSARFDGTRGYVKAAFDGAPLYVLNLTDPTAPELAAEIDTSVTSSSFLFPLGDRLVSVGFDLSDYSNIRPAVSLFDVSDINDPRELSTVSVGSGGYWDSATEAAVDDKALKILEDAGLILLPFATLNEVGTDYIDALQLIELKQSELVVRGQVVHPGLVRRADLRDGRIWVLSDLGFQTVDVADLDVPISLSTLRFVGDQELLDSGLNSCVASARQGATAFNAIDDLYGLGCFPVGFAALGLSLAGLCFGRRR